ncbi:alcohol dehydrogenase catalytic domain-containing protein [Nocardia vinacea]|uniref:alcohol dehydrogenase catalytic domain-containing protein n=1 Tax=Nocardia vinacea TaxID=96468 RepID=UPI002E102CE8|nr:alcohol dehydrogenase catalytic domain-containing protein [Nocardia vinacea]
MRAVVIETPEEFAVQNVPDPTPGPGEVVVRVDAVGICGTDVHIADGEFPPTPYPIVPGHEFAGSVVAQGTDVDGVRIGDTVAVDPSLFCGACHYCAVGRGVFQQFGVAPGAATASISPFRIYNDEITIVGSMAVLNSFGRAVELLGKGVIDANTMITHSFGLAEFADALQTFRAGNGRKIQLRPGA